MALLGVPWAIDSGALHSAVVGRIVSYIGGSGETGIVLAGDLNVQKRATAGGGVLIAPGAANIVSRYTGAKSESYVVVNDAQEDLPVAANNTGSTVTRYVIIRIYDPQYPLQPAPPSVPNGPYNYFEVVTSITNLTYPFIALAKLTIPANTSAIQTSYIEDLRVMCNPRVKIVPRTRPHVVSDGAAGLTLTFTSVDGEWFPNQGGEQYIDIPSWATKVHIRAEWMGVLYPNTGDGWGEYWVDWGPIVSAQKLLYRTENYRWDMPVAGFSRTNWICVDTMDVPASMRGQKNVQFLMKARKAGGTAVVTMNERSGVALTVTFYEEPILESSS